MRRRVIRRVGIAALVLGSLLLLAWAGVVAYAAGDLVVQARTAKALATGGIAAVDADAVTTVLARTQRDVVALRQQVGWLVGPVAHLRWLPKVGPLLGEGPALLELGDSLSELAVLLWADAGPSLTHYQQGEPWQDLLAEVLPAIARGLEHKQDLAHRAVEAYADLDVAALPAAVTRYVSLLGQGLPFLADGLEVAAVAPSLLGFDEPQTYLVLALNEDELRPGGGFITGVGEVQVASADVVSMVFRDSYAVDDYSLPYPDPPEPLRQFLGLDLWVFRDSNWSPDFPTAARQALELYRPDVPAHPVGVVAIDQRAVQLLMKGLGSIQIPGLSEPVTADTVFDYMYQTWAPEDGVQDADWWRQRKSFIGELASAGMARVRSGNVDLSALATAVMGALDRRHIQVYVEDRVAQQVLSYYGWDGQVAASASDYLALVEADLGYNKASRYIVRTLRYEIDLSGSIPQAEAVVQLTHTSDRESVCKPELRYDAIYEDMMHRCYWAYLRLFVPQGAALIDATLSPIPANLVFSQLAWPGEVLTSAELGHTAFHQALLLPTGAQKELRFAYALPPSILRQESDGSFTYRLVVRKQAGVEQLTGVVALHLPANAVVLTTLPDRFQTEGDLLVTDYSSAMDLELMVHYRLP